MAAPKQIHGVKKKIRKKKPRNKPILEPGATDSLQDSSLIRALGSPDRDTRERGLQLLTAWLETHEDVSEHDILRLWKGLYFCFWHSDLITVQTALAERLAGLIVNLSPRVALAYFRGFVQTMRREWAGIDQHRMNKYLVLVRKVYAAALMRLERSKWDPDVVERYCVVLEDDVLAMPTANDLGAGFAYFVCDIAVEEMVKAGEASGAGKRQLKGRTVVALLQPFIEGMVATKNKILLTRLYTGVFAEVARNAAERAKPFDSVDVVGLAEDLFARGSDRDTRAPNRKYMYEASSKLELAAKQLKQGEDSGDRQSSRKAKPGNPKAGKSKDENAKVEREKSKKKQTASPEKVEAAREKKRSEKRATALGSPIEIDIQASKPKKKKTKRASSDGESTRSGEKARKQATRNGQAADKKTSERPPLRKSVRINLKKNLVRRIGEAPYPENVRTPPTSKPRGSALKVMGATNKGRSSVKRSLKMIM